MAHDHAGSPSAGQRRRAQRAPDGPSDASASLLASLLAPVRRVALVGLAKNTGKTETLGAILAAHARAGRSVGVTSIGRDGEERDVLDSRIAKPPIRLHAGSIVASTGPLLRASALAHERLAQTGIRTPLGEVVIARLGEDGAVEVAGPSAAADVRAVSDAMAQLGAEQVLIDGAVDRRAASAPEVSDALVMATGAVLGDDVEQVAAATAQAVELVRLPRAGEDVEPPLAVARPLALRAEPEEVAALLREHPSAGTLAVQGALDERFLEALLAARRERAGRELRILAGDPTKVFLARHGPGWYRRQGISIEVLHTIELKALTVNPVAPQSHRLDSARLRTAIEAAVGDVPVLDVRDGAAAAS
jgi:hypothetical protein